MIKFYLAIAFIWLFLLIPTKLYAQEADSYKIDYNVEYLPLSSQITHVELTAKIVNSRSDIFIKQFTLSFPKNFPIENIKVLSDTTLNPQITNSQTTDLTFDLPEETQGRGEDTIIKIEYDQKNLFKKNGTVYEFIAPTISSKKNTQVKATLHIPTFIQKNPSLIKPRASTADIKTITWDNIKTPTIYVLFGQSQSYHLQLRYHLVNPGFTQKTISIALPPETLYQALYVEKIEPQPVETHIDLDGNYIANFVLGPHTNKTIYFNGVVQVFVKPQQNLKPYIESSFKDQKKYLFQKTPYWNLADLSRSKVIVNLSSLSQIYQAVIDTLEYRFEKITDRKRLGAKGALSQKNNAVCSEYTDLFVALGREKGHYVREVQGYGFSSDRRLRPLSLVSDVLHSWAEYYDSRENIWRPVDPTWQDTSKIDYFSSFDVNHVALAIHGKSDSQPLPAGMYKVKNTKDIIITPLETFPLPDSKPVVTTNIKPKIITDREYGGTVTIENKGSTFIKNQKLTIESGHLNIKPSEFNILLLAPFQKQQFNFSYKTKEDSDFDQITFLLDKEPISKKKVTIKSTGADIVMSAIGIVIGAIFLALLLYLKARNK